VGLECRRSLSWPRSVSIAVGQSGGRDAHRGKRASACRGRAEGDLGGQRSEDGVDGCRGSPSATGAGTDTGTATGTATGTSRTSPGSEASPEAPEQWVIHARAPLEAPIPRPFLGPRLRNLRARTETNMVLSSCLLRGVRGSHTEGGASPSRWRAVGAQEREWEGGGGGGGGEEEWKWEGGP